MQIDNSTAIVDNDFINHLVGSRLADDLLVRALLDIFNSLSLVAAIHPLVYDKELFPQTDRIKLLFQKEVIRRLTFGDAFEQGSDEETYYCYLVGELYVHLNGCSLPVAGREVLSYWKRRESLGEVHSLSLCLVCGCGIFLSDDSDSKRLAEYIIRKSLGTVCVYNRKELIDKSINEAATQIPRKIRQSLGHTGA